MTERKSRRPNSRRLLWAGGISFVTVAAIVGAFLWWFFRSDAPEEVSLEAAIEANAEALPSATTTPIESQTTPTTTAEVSAGQPIDAATTVPATSTPTTIAETTEGDLEIGPTADPSPLAGEWTVDTSIGSFDYESASGSFAGFRVEEQLEGIGSNTAVGRTGDIDGTLDIDGTTATRVSVEVDLSTLTTNDPRRDGRLPSILSIDDHPIATFELSSPIDFGAAAADGEPVASIADGDLTIAGVTNAVEFDLEAQLIDDVIIVVGSAPIEFQDFGIDPPSNPPLLEVDDTGIVELQLLFTRDDSELAIEEE